MDWNEVARHWNDAPPEIKSRWSKLTDDDLRAIDAKKERLVEKIEEKYGVLEEEALVEVDEWLEKRSPPAEVRPYRVAVFVAIAFGVLFAGFVFVPLPWGPSKYVVLALMALVLMAILFRRRPRLEF